jgi:hypothetical protein
MDEVETNLFEQGRALPSTDRASSAPFYSIFKSRL